MGLTTGIYCAIIKCAVICLVVILTVTILRIAHSPFAPFFSRWYYRAYVDDAVLTALHPAANFSSTSSSIRYQLSLNITFAIAYGKTGYRDCSATAWYKNSMLNAPQDWIPPDQSKHGTKETKWTNITFWGTVVVYPSVAAELARERSVGTVHVRVRLSTATMEPSDHSRINYIDHDCWLWFPAPGDDAAPAVFGEGTRCWPVK